MDKPRPSQARKKRIRRIFYGTLIVLFGGGAAWGLSRLEPAAPRIDAATVYMGTVERGEMVRNVRGLGKLVPEEIRWITSKTSGIVERIFAEPGVEVTADTILMELSSPELEQATRDLELQLEAAEIDLANQVVELESSLLGQQTTFAGVEGDYELAELDYEAESELHASGIRSDLDFARVKLAYEQAANRLEMERRRLEIAELSNDAQLRAAELRLDQTRGQYELKLQEFDGLQVRAGVGGTLQQVPVEVGQQIGSGTNVARVAEPSRLKAELDIAETQAQDIILGQHVDIDTRNGVIPGSVIRIDPAVENGSVQVDVRLEGELPRGARPDLSVDGTIEIERLEDVMYVGRPAFGQADSLVSMYKVLDTGEATRVQVRLGRTSVSTMEVIEGLNVGDVVILSDMSAWDEFDRVRLD